VTVHSLRTSNDPTAYELATCYSGLKVSIASDGALEVSAEKEVLEAYLMTLTCCGVAVRALEHRPRSVVSLILELTRPLDSRDESPDLVAAKS
jgi:hypothetical protein